MFDGLILTNAGLDLLSRGVAGHEIEFTSIKMGNGVLVGSASVLTDLVSVKHTLAIYNMRKFDINKVLVGSVLQGSQITEAFYWKELGVFAHDKTLNDSPILFAYDNAGAEASYVPAGGTVIEQVINVVMVMSNVSTISAVINESLVYLLKNNPDFSGILKSGEKEVLFVDTRIELGDGTLDLLLKANDSIYAEIDGVEYEVLTTRDFVVSAIQPTAVAGRTIVWFEDEVIE